MTKTSRVWLVGGNSDTYLTAAELNSQVRTDSSSYSINGVYVDYVYGSIAGYSSGFADSSLSSSTSAAQRTVGIITSAPASTIASKLGISMSDITSITLYATLYTVRTSGAVTAEPVRITDYTITDSSAYLYVGTSQQSAQSLSSGQNNLSYTFSTSLNISSSIGVSFTYTTSGDQTSDLYRGIGVATLYADVTYAECEASFSSASVNGTNIKSSAASITSSSAKLSLNSSISTSHCSTTTVKWQSIGYGTTVIATGTGSQSAYIDHNPMYVIARIYDSDGNTVLATTAQATITPNPTINFSTTATCKTIKVSYTNYDSSAPYTYLYELYDDTESTLVSSGTGTDEYTFTNLSSDTTYKARITIKTSSSVIIKVSDFKEVTTTKSVVSLSVSETKCTKVVLTGNDSCEGSLTYYYKKDGGSYSSTSNPTISGLTPNTKYYFYATSSTGGTSKEISTTTTVNISFALVEDTTSEHTSTFNIDYPKALVIKTSSNCDETVITKYSTDNGATWSSALYNGNSVNVYNYNKTYRFKSYVMNGSTEYGTKYIEVTISAPADNSCKIWRTYLGTQYTANIGDTASVYPTSPYLMGYANYCSYEQSPILTKTYSYTVGSTTVTTSTLTFDVVYPNTYSITGKTVYKCGSDTVYTNNTSLIVNSIQFTQGQITATSATLSTAVIGGNGATATSHETTAGEEVYINARQWGTGKNKYTYTALVSPNSTPHSWTTLTDADGSFVSMGEDYSLATLIPYNTEKLYTFTYKIQSTDDIGHTELSSSTPQTCAGWLTAKIGIVADVSLTPEPAVGKKDETEFEADCTDSFVRGYDEAVITAKWSMYRSTDLTTDVWDSVVTVTSGSRTDKNVKFTMKDNGDFVLYLTLNGTYSGGTLPETTWYDSIGIKEIITTGITDTNRFSLVFYNSTKMFIATRSSVPYMNSLKFNKSLGNIGSLTCTITGANRVKMTDNTAVSELLTTAGTYVCLLDRMNPIWIGILTNPAELDTNYYDKSTQVSQYEVTAYECTKALGTDYLPNTSKGLISGTLTDVVKAIIPTSNQGLIGSSSVNYGVSLSNTSRLTALDQLYNQCGWRYRCRPNTEVFWKDITGSYTKTSCIIPSADLIDSLVVPEVGDVLVFYSEGKYGCAFIGSVAGTGNPNYTITYGGSFNLPELATDVMVTIVKGYLIDFKPTYYQTYNTRTWTVNKDATDADVSPNIRDKFGTAIVYGVGYSGETIASKMRAWMKINKDYTIDNAMKITRSYDSEIDTVVKLDEVEYNAVKYSRYVITFNGWSFPNASTLSRLTSKPTIYFVNLNGELHSMTIGYDISSSYPLATDNPRRYYDQGNNKKCAYTIAVNQSEYADNLVTLKTSVIESLVQLSNVIFNTFAVDKFTKLPEVSSTNHPEICVGDMICTIQSKNSQYSEVVVNYNAPQTGWESTGIPHGHMTDVLVMDNSGTYNYSNPNPESPYALYSETSLTTQGPEGYSMMEMERLACRYMQYGSNYSAQCKATISAPFFYRDDFEIGASRLPMVGDRIAIKKMEEAGYVTNVYELQTYEFDFEKYTVKITFGMPFLNVGEVIYNMLSNSGLSMIPADS